MCAADRPYAEREWPSSSAAAWAVIQPPAIPPTATRSGMRRGGSRIASTGTSRTATGVRYPASQMPTLADMHGAVDTIGHVYERYHNLLTASS